MGDMLDFVDGAGDLKEACRLIVARLLRESPAPQVATSPQDRDRESQQLRHAAASVLIITGGFLFRGSRVET
jgi:hypothetical protein